MLIQSPKIVEVSTQSVAVIRLTIPRSEIRQVMGPAMGEVMAAAHAQDIGPAGPLFAHHFQIDPEVFDFEVGVPVDELVAAVGRVEAGELPACTVAQALYRGDYERLGEAWRELDWWIEANGHTPAKDRWEVYVSGPGSSPSPAHWITELNRPLLGYSAATS
ncbi:MAG: GyrI-like domain-containing protein [Bryobacterales bacterium]|nr:GyrI-like domain-containing protein [Acidobacteriota bacterium]MCB9383358.1 GyrI-like domain-containing protein [Bryobacterales bacterium]